MAHRLREVLDVAHRQCKQRELGGEHEVGCVHDPQHPHGGVDLDADHKAEIEAVGQGRHNLRSRRSTWL